MINFSPYKVGERYKTQAGNEVLFVSVHAEGTPYETMADEQGIHRYTRRDFGRVTGSPHDYSDPRNVPPTISQPRLSPDGTYLICDTCKIEWKPGAYPGCAACSFAFALDYQKKSRVSS